MTEDVVFRILLWLPIASLMRFKSVCKSWLSLIESPCFITQHLHHLHLPYLYSEENILVVTHPNHNERAPCFSLSLSLLSGNNFQVSQNFHVPLPLPHSSIKEGVQCARIFASCDGIICIQHDNYKDISLLNPRTKQCRILPRLPLPLPLPQISQGECYSHVVGGFGFDVKSNDYKLVRILEVLSGFRIPKVIERQVDVYSLNTDSWITIDHAALPTGISILDSDDVHAPFQNGIHCWLGEIPSSIENGVVSTWIKSVVSFDFSKCMFQTMPLPDVYTDGHFNLRLALLRENIACIHQAHCRLGKKYDCNIWVMKEFGVKESWYKLCTVQLDQYNYAVGFSKNGEILYKKEDYVADEAELCLCDPVTQELQPLPIQALHPYFKIAVYKESLVSIKSLNGENNIVRFNSGVEPDCEFA